MNREQLTLETMKQGIITQASRIAGAAFDNREKTGSLAEQLRKVAYDPLLGSDDDEADDVISDLISLAREAEELGL